MRVMVTGASGFVGRWALQSLARPGIELYGVSRRRPEIDGTFTWLELDLLEPTAGMAVAAARPDIVLHLAWFVEPGAFWTSSQNLAWIDASLRLAQAAAGAGAKRFVGIGTCFEYHAPDDADCEEDETALAPQTLYAVSKDATRRVLSAYLADHGIAFTWARLFFLYGPGEAPGRLVSSICRALVAGEPARCSRGLAVRDFMDVRDAGAALATIALSSFTGAVNVATGYSVSVAEISRRLGELAGRAELVRLGSLPDRAGEPPRITASGARLRAVTGDERPRTLDDGLTDALHHWANNPAFIPK